MSPARVSRLRRTRDVPLAAACIVGLGYGFAALSAAPASPEPVPSFVPVQLPTLDVE